MPMSIVKASDVAYVRFKAPELDRMRAFLKTFGMTEVANDTRGTFMRGTGRAPFVHATELGEPGFAAVGIWVDSLEDLERLAAHDGVAVEAFDAPGGGSVVRLRDPDGNLVEAVSGQTWAEEEPAEKPLLWNEGPDRARVAAFRRTASGPSHVRRLGHVVFAVSDFRRSEAWYKERFGLVTSDEIQPAPGVTVGAFLRCDRGEDPCDHHTLFLFQQPGTLGFMHAAFEVASVDDLMVGHDHLKAAGYNHLWGIGRHNLGSQVFDYWLDPYGHEIEHWTDGDQLRASDGGGVGTLDQLMGVQWGMKMPPVINVGEQG
jgi:catechol 2,3-dioxygenase-like lactoylglutathione lyase family enzyme